MLAHIAAEVIIGTILATGAFVVAIIKMFLMGYDKSIKASFKQISDAHKELSGAMSQQQKELHRLEKDILAFRAELPERYQRREDAIRQEVLIIAKVDALASKIDMLAMRGTAHAD